MIVSTSIRPIFFVHIHWFEGRRSLSGLVIVRSAQYVAILSSSRVLTDWERDQSGRIKYSHWRVPSQIIILFPDCPVGIIHGIHQSVKKMVLDHGYFCVSVVMRLVHEDLLFFGWIVRGFVVSIVWRINHVSVVSGDHWTIVSLVMKWSDRCVVG